MKTGSGMKYNKPDGEAASHPQKIFLIGEK